jgi:phosphonate dehydrogenase
MTRPCVVVSHRVFPETLALLASHAEVLAPSGEAEALSPEALSQGLAEAQAWMAFMPDAADAETLARAPNLRLIAGALKGADNFDIEACTRGGVWFSLAPDLLTEPTAELAVGLMIGLGRQLRAGDAHVRSGDFQGWRPRLYGRGLAGARIAYVGFGAIGRGIAVRLQAFGVQQRYVDARAQPVAGATPAASLNELLGWGDYVVLCAPLTAATTELIDRTALARLQPHALLINPARGSLVDEAAVLEALQAGRLGGYAADVFAFEDWARADRPSAIPAGLLAHPATLFTPHLGSAVVEVRRAIEEAAALNILDALSGRTPRDAVNPEARQP